MFLSSDARTNAASVLLMYVTRDDKMIRVLNLRDSNVVLHDKMISNQNVANYKIS